MEISKARLVYSGRKQQNEVHLELGSLVYCEGAWILFARGSCLQKFMEQHSLNPTP